MDLAYAAGLIDGEGCISTMTRRGYVTPRLEVGMTVKAKHLLDDLARTFGGNVRLFREETDRWAKAYHWTMVGTPVAEVMEALLPHLRLKQDQARLVIELEELRASMERRANGSASWTDDGLRRAGIIAARISEMNQKGPERKRAPAPDLEPLAEYRWGYWWEPQESLFGPVEFDGPWPTSGMMVDGVVYATPEPPTDGSGSSSSPNLPTPTSRDWKDGPPNGNVPVNALLGRAVWEL